MTHFLVKTYFTTNKLLLRFIGAQAAMAAKEVSSRLCDRIDVSVLRTETEKDFFRRFEIDDPHANGVLEAPTLKQFLRRIALMVRLCAYEVAGPWRSRQLELEFRGNRANEAATIAVFNASPGSSELLQQRGPLAFCIVVNTVDFGTAMASGDEASPLEAAMPIVPSPTLSNF